MSNANTLPSTFIYRVERMASLREGLASKFVRVLMQASETDYIFLINKVDTLLSVVAHPFSDN